jgi:DeoR/GlpR family transcriptional regulator of sugar metabolism
LAQVDGIVKRRDEVAELICRKGFLSLAELSGVLGVSESTIRRDLEILEEQGLLRRTHGGAVSVQELAAANERQTTASAEKRGIARAVAGLIGEDQTVIIDGGTTCLQVAAALVGRRMSVITNSAQIASLLSGEVATEVTLIGGYLYPRTGVALGPMAEEMLGRFRAEQVVLSCAAANADGFFNGNEMMTSLQRRMIEVADHVIMAIDHTKFGKRAVAPLCNWSDVDVLVTDSDADAEWRAFLAQTGVKTILAEPVR